MILIEMFRSVFVSYFLVMDLSVGVIVYAILNAVLSICT
jgi:hypothetical protein